MLPAPSRLDSSRWTQIHDQLAPCADSTRQSLESAATDAVRAYAARTRESADQIAAVLEGFAENGLPAVDDCIR
ncbi:hypothetical protein EHS43_15520 [Streptomyces sp. RP5T]|nr:hypothetical protein EHS43_15520 [Streptomyces sp. RP5T]